MNGWRDTKCGRSTGQTLGLLLDDLYEVAERKQTRLQHWSSMLGTAGAVPHDTGLLV